MLIASSHYQHMCHKALHSHVSCCDCVLSAGVRLNVLFTDGLHVHDNQILSHFSINHKYVH